MEELQQEPFKYQNNNQKLDVKLPLPDPSSIDQIQPLVLRVDSREPEKIFHILDKEGYKYIKDTLPIGDFVFGDICFERKTLSDFASSIMAGHLQKQLLQMQDSFEHCYLLLSGNYVSEIAASEYMKKWSVNHHIGALASVATRYPKIKMVHVDNDTQLVHMVEKICEKLNDGRSITIQHTELLKNQLKGIDLKLAMLTCIPRLGFNKAEKIAEKVDIKLTNKDGSELTKNDLMRIEGVGHILADSILKVNLK